LSFSADSDAIVTTPSTETGADGKLQSTLTIGSNRANRVITVTVTSGSVSKTATVQVLGRAPYGYCPSAVVAPSAAGKIQYRCLIKRRIRWSVKTSRSSRSACRR
jgi:hypothetical protein